MCILYSSNVLVYLLSKSINIIILLILQTIQQLDLQLCSAESAHEEGDKHNFARKGRTI